MCLFIQSQEEKDVATVELIKLYILHLKVWGWGGGNSEYK